MDQTNLPVTSGSPDALRMAVTPSRSTTDFVDIDLSTPTSSKVALVPPSVIGALDLSPQNSPQVFAVPALPLLSRSTEAGIHQLRPTNPTMIHGNSSKMAPTANPPVQTRSDTSVMSQCRPPVDVQVGVIQKCSRTDGGSDLVPPCGQTPVYTSMFCPSDAAHRALLITEAAAKQAFEEYSNSRCCYGSAPAKEMTTEELQPLNAYRYCLETFTESRSCEWVTEKNRGQYVDVSNVGFAPQPWDVPVSVPDMFRDATQKMVVPNTVTLKACSHCNGMGMNMCLKCHGTGRIQCMWCNGSGRHMQMEMCSQCYGRGNDICRLCTNRRIQNCVACAGKGQVLNYLLLTVTWKNNKYDFVSDQNSEFSSNLFKTVHGERIYTDEQPSVSPLTHFPDSSIILASQNALDQHGTQFSSCRVIRQRQSVELLPLTKVRYTWKGKQLNYFVYGKENKVHVQNYPQKCCCLVM
ncbi:protein SSUH2 homolog [Leptodactylus fuscus]|uniref:protein SSUH2 homolog n=1 Tax=Leptodactylus fuscus TaxID=238119 RepID=UPI003F4F30DF